MMPPVLSVPPPDGPVVGCGRRSSAEAWTGEKKRKAAGCSFPPPGLVSSVVDDSSLFDDLFDLATGSSVQEEQGGQGGGLEEDFVFSEENDIGYEELCRFFQVLRSREDLLYVNRAHKLRGDAKCELYERLLGLRHKEYRISKEIGQSLDETTEVWDFEDASEPGPSMFGWTIDTQCFHLVELNDYQRIVPMRTTIYEYSNWEEYRITLSKYDTDVDYVKYCDEISKKIKWIEKYITQEYEQVFTTYKDRGYKQAQKIATSFSHLPLSLATRGYEEYILDLYHKLVLEDYIHSYFELWKRLVKQEMSFEDALNQTLSENKFHYPRGIERSIKGLGQLFLNFKSCMAQIPECDVQDDEVLKLITDVVHSKSERPKRYVDYVKKKLEVARRINLTKE